MKVWHDGKSHDWQEDALHESLSALFDAARTKASRLARRPVVDVLRVLDELATFWRDADSELYQNALTTLPQTTGFSRAMVKKGLDLLPHRLSGRALERKLDSELPGASGIHPGTFHEQAGHTTFYTPLGVVFHVLSGNVFLSGVSSFLEGALTRNVNIFKLASAETEFMPIFLESLRRVDTEGVLWPFQACLELPSKRHDLLAIAKTSADGIVVWGGEEAVKAWRENLPARTRLVVFGPKLSFAYVSARALGEPGALRTTAESLAADVAIWDQNACTAPQICFVEGEAQARALLVELGAALAREEQACPAGDVDFHTAAEIRKLRGVAEVQEALGEGHLVDSAEGLAYTAMLSRETSLEPSPLHRTLKVVPVENLNVVTREMDALRGYVQSVGVTCIPKEEDGLRTAFFTHGAVRVCALGEMSGGDMRDPHDGGHDLPQLVNIVFARSLSGAKPRHPLELLAEDERRYRIDAQLRWLLHGARKSAFYAHRLAQAPAVQGTADLDALPLLTRHGLDIHHPPVSDALATGPWEGGYVARSGGTTGEPKFSIYDGADWEAMMAASVRIFRAAGLEAGDRLANCMLAGDLYGSFVSFDHINVRAGVTTFAFAQNVTPDALAATWRRFRFNAIEGVPSLIVPLLRKAKELEPELRLEKVLFAGQPMSTADQLWLRQTLGITRISSVIGANDGGPIGYQCEHLSGAVHHTVDDVNFMEIVDDTGKPVPWGEVGRIVITSLHKHALPLIRYDLGDRGRFVSQACACGRTGRIFEHLGRTDDMLCLGMMNVRHGDLVAAVSHLPLSELQMVARSHAAGEELIVRVEAAAPTVDLECRIEEALMTQVPQLASRLAEGQLTAVTVEIHDVGHLARNPRSGKVRQVIDERNTSGKGGPS